MTYNSQMQRHMIKGFKENYIFNSAYWVIFQDFFCHLQIFFKINFFKNSFRNTNGMPNGLDPELGPSCLQKLSADNKICHKQAKI